MILRNRAPFYAVTFWYDVPSGSNPLQKREGAQSVPVVSRCDGGWVYRTIVVLSVWVCMEFVAEVVAFADQVETCANFWPTASVAEMVEEPAHFDGQCKGSRKLGIKW